MHLYCDLVKLRKIQLKKDKGDNQNESEKDRLEEFLANLRQYWWVENLEK